MQRRRLITASLIGSAVLAGGGAVAWYRHKTGNEIFTMDQALAKIDALAGKNLTHSGAWNPAQIFAHCAQTVEFSMSAYPAPKSALFQDTVGRAAYAVFAARQKMLHSLHEPIAGAPALDVALAPEAALQRLRTALTTFRDFKGPLAPHFAYGALSKEEYALAHVMHFSNHLEELALA